MARPRTTTPDDVERAREMRLRGATWAQISAALGVSRHAIARALEADGGAPTPPVTSCSPSGPRVPVSPPAELPPPPDDEVALEDVGAGLSLADQRVWYSELVQRYTQEEKRMRAIGDVAAAIKCSTLAVAANNALARINRSAAADAVVMTRDEIKATVRQVRERIKAYRKNKTQLVCAHCRRELVSRWVEGKDEMPSGET